MSVPLHDSSPQRRSQLRLSLGRIYYTWQRKLQLIASGAQYAHHTNPGSKLIYQVFTHKTPLLRKLRQVEMQLQYNKITNLHLAGQTMNGLILKPGEVFLFWKLVGKPTKGKGYLKGMVLSNGSFYPGTGGGLCQLSNLIYWMTLHTPLTVTERWRHNYDVFPDSDRTQPFGSGATVGYNYIDLQIQNNTETDYQLLVWLDDEFLHGAWLCSQPPNYQYQVYEREHIINAAWWGGYIRSNVLCRKILNADGIEVGDEHVCSNQAIMMYQPLLPQDGVT